MTNTTNSKKQTIQSGTLVGALIASAIAVGCGNSSSQPKASTPAESSKTNVAAAPKPDATPANATANSPTTAPTAMGRVHSRTNGSNTESLQHGPDEQPGTVKASVPIDQDAGITATPAKNPD